MADDDKKKPEEMSEDEKLAAEWEAAMQESGDDEAEPDEVAFDAAGADDKADSGKGKQPKVKTPEMEEFDNAAAAKAEGITQDLDVILDIPVTISMEVGNTQIAIRNLLQLNQGSVIELDRLAGEPLDVLVNGTLIAHGEVVMVNDKFGIRLTDVISPGERIKRLSK
ncbi:MAG: flagellar motor switch protein FliN [Oleiphilaceae bacterium]|nr:flagellar motor switch protein FliN [Oleiphilaceae bacterium]